MGSKQHEPFIQFLSLLLLLSKNIPPRLKVDLSQLSIVKGEAPQSKFAISFLNHFSLQYPVPVAIISFFIENRLPIDSWENRSMEEKNEDDKEMTIQESCSVCGAFGINIHIPKDEGDQKSSCRCPTIALLCSINLLLDLSIESETRNQLESSFSLFDLTKRLLLRVLELSSPSGLTANIEVSIPVLGVESPSEAKQILTIIESWKRNLRCPPYG